MLAHVQQNCLSTSTSPDGHQKATALLVPNQGASQPPPSQAASPQKWVGYTIRFEDVSDKERTRILYMTDGMLFRETLIDPLLSRYSVIMIDEAHERSIYTDLLLGVLKKIRRKRPSLRIIVSSATLDAAAFLEYFTSGNAPEEATIPVPDYVQKAAEVVWGIHLQQTTGDILVFLSGRDEIDRCLEILSELLPTLPRNAKRLQLLALHAGLTTDEQLRVFEPTERGWRKVVVATNIAEASVTIDGIKYVVDSGFVKLQPTTPPEITRTDLTTPILQLKSLGIDDLMKFEWVSSPPAESVLRALEGLVHAGMIDEDGRLTVIGEKVAECPVEVNIARMLFASKDYKCGEEILTIAAMTTIQDVFVIPEGAAGALAELERRKFTAEEGDHLTLLNDGTYRAVRGDTVLHVHPHSVLFTRKPRSGWVIFHEMEETKKTQIRILTEIEPDW
ncbi:hypothetical protein BN946_scf184834.g6 [Trametes cinnabarina]|uniref:RNA helicase n=1 Tax=Pycnoporus cinnabarinus TaxID=5643 RepID=A0A060S9P2_PYCCI|nr:hypothetical protein BN946_scf184834.g6 [Trametes cinnabarina]